MSSSRNNNNTMRTLLLLSITSNAQAFTNPKPNAFATRSTISTGNNAFVGQSNSNGYRRRRTNPLISFEQEPRNARLQMSSEAGSDPESLFGDIEPVFEDVDGIGAAATPAVLPTEILVTEESMIETIMKTPTRELELEAIGSITGTTDAVITTGGRPTNSTIGIEDCFTSKMSDETQKELMDPAAVVEAVIGTALSDSDSNGVISTLNLRKDADAVAVSIVQDAINDKLDKNKEMIEEEEEIIDTPSLAKIIKFAIPAIGVWLCSPLLSLIDTSSVGLLSGTIQQAALNPAVAVTDYGALLVAFMYTATTNLVAGAKESERNSEAKPKTTKALINSLQVSGYVGSLLGAILVGFGPKILRAIIGNDALDPAVFAAALRYVRIRALGMPAAVIIGSAQSACLGMQDIKSPLYVLLAAAIVNFFGDVLFVPNTNAWIGGAAGAAWATVFSQYAALFMFIKWLTHKPKPPVVNLTNAILELTGESTEGKSRRKRFRRALKKLSLPQNKRGRASSASTTTKEDEVVTAAAIVADVTAEDNTSGEQTESLLQSSTSATTATSPSSGPSPVKRITTMFRGKENKRENKNEKDGEKEFSVRGFLADELKMRNLFQFPAPEDAKTFWPYVIPVTTTAVGRVSSYVAMSHVVSSSLGTLSMAANQIILSVFYCLTPVADSLNLTAQSFLPGIFQQKWSKKRGEAIRMATNNFIKAGSVFGCAMVTAVACIPLLSRFFTADPLVIAQVNSCVPSLLGIFALHGIICAGEGVLLGQKDLTFLGKAYGAYFFIVPYFMLQVKKLALQGANVGINSLWNVFMYYQVLRSSVWLVRLKMLSSKAMKDKIPVEE